MVEKREATKEEQMIAAGQYLRQKRIDAQYSSLRELARHLGLSASYMSDIERGKRPISHKLAARLSGALKGGYSADDAGPTVYDSILILNGTLSPERAALLDLIGPYIDEYPGAIVSGVVWFALWNQLVEDDNDPQIQQIHAWYGRVNNQ